MINLFSLFCEVLNISFVTFILGLFINFQAICGHHVVLITLRYLSPVLSTEGVNRMDIWFSGQPSLRRILRVEDET